MFTKFGVAVDVGMGVRDRCRSPERHINTMHVVYAVALEALRSSKSRRGASSCCRKVIRQSSEMIFAPGLGSGLVGGEAAYNSSIGCVRIPPFLERIPIPNGPRYHEDDYDIIEGPCFYQH